MLRKLIKSAVPKVLMLCFCIFSTSYNTVRADTSLGETIVEYSPNAEEKVEYRILKRNDSKLPQTGEQKSQVELIIFCIILLLILICFKENEQDLK